MEKLKRYTKEFISDEEGMEFLQVAIIVTLVAMLIVALIFLFNIIKDKIYEAGDEASDVSNSFNPNRSNPGGAEQPNP